jgi:hypothetical protein
MARKRDYIAVPQMLPARPPGLWSRMRRKLFGWSMILVGIAGLVLPLLNGTLFLAIGLYVLKDDYVWAAKAIDWARRRFPRQAASMDRGQAKAEEYLKHTRRTLRRYYNTLRR